MQPDSSTSGKLLNNLFGILKKTRSDEEAGAVEDMIWTIWMEGGSEETNTMMKRGCRFLENHNYDSAIRVFARMIRRNGHYAEAWNKRATAYYLRGDYKLSIDDIRHTLQLEPRHFGALSGWASISLVVGDHWGALKALERLYELRPNQPGLRQQINDLHVQILNERRRE